MNAIVVSLVLVMAMVAGCTNYSSDVTQVGAAPIVITTLVTPATYEPTLAPIHPNNVAIAIPAPTPTTALASPDAIVGTWQLMGQSKPADCTVQINPDNTGIMTCNKFGVQVAQQQFTWMPLASPYLFTDDYAFNVTNGGGNYTASYSERNGWITSDVLPPGTDLERGS